MRRVLSLPSLCLCALSLASCASASADPPGGPAPSDPEGSVSRADAQGDRPRVRFALARHLERATLHDGETLHVELGDASGSRHTAGGWLSGFGPDREVAGARAALTLHRRARLALPGRGAPAELAVRLTSFRPGAARLYLDGAEIATVDLEPERWTTTRVALTEAQLSVGEHELLLRMDRSQTVEGVGRARLAVDWVRLGPGGGEPGDARPSALEEEGIPTLRIPAGWRVSQSMVPPEGARLRGVARDGVLEIWGRGEQGDATRLGRVDASRGPRRFDVDLARVAGDYFEVELRAESAVRLYQPAIVTLDGGAPTHVRRPRHVLVYLIDTLRADRLGAYAPQGRVRTPGLDRFARGAATFVQARAQENWTKPSVATLMSSLLPWEHTAFADASEVPRTVRLMPEILNERGFATAGFVANGYVSRRFGFRRGWDHWRNYIREGRRTRGELVAADALAWLDQRPADQPFFLYVHAIDPHVPYRPPARYVEMYDPDPYRGPVDFSRDATLLERIKTGGLRLSERDRRHLVALYDGEVSYQDAQLASILDGLERRGLADETMVVITADHGEELFDHGSVGHGHSLYDELVRVPLLVRVPGLPTRRVDGSVGLVDVLPTVLDVLGEPIPDDLSGRSLLPALRGDGEDAPSFSVSGFMEHWRSVASGRFKLVARSRGRYALFDLEADPGETHDLSDERPRTLAYMRGLLGLALSETRDGAHRQRRRPRHRPSRAAVDDELRAQLEALGYVGTSRRD
ncbi:MAG: hypothetical protein SangKO_017010 [Sandaracinaceae bacterium]